jgi:hypothetical protein
MTLKQTLDKLASQLSDKAAKDNTPLQESIDAFKALTAYYAAQQKNRKNQADDEPDSQGFSFAGSDEVVNGSPGQRKAVHPRRNS